MDTIIVQQFDFLTCYAKGDKNLLFSKYLKDTYKNGDIFHHVCLGKDCVVESHTKVSQILIKHFLVQFSYLQFLLLVAALVAQ